VQYFLKKTGKIPQKSHPLHSNSKQLKKFMTKVEIGGKNEILAK